ncbi:MAG TPA: YebC/PmpR family DNA-binding transcriptional regulator [Chloroflexota bacterium]|nr:YebC/PmpR family DNA-binding transcriptional regulator [Chloroflexota bacterium]
MSGHSKWAKIKHQKAGSDAKRGQLFTKLGREITIAAREGGGDVDANVRLRLAVQRARDANMPGENIDRAIKHGAGQGDGVSLEEAVYEGYGPGGAAMMVEVATDNRNRAAAEVRNAFTRGGGNMGESGCVAWIFELRGVIEVEADGHDPDELALQAIDAGAEDVQSEGELLSIYTNPSELEQVRLALAGQNVPITSAETTMVPKTTIATDDETAMRILRLVDRLEELDDVQKVYTNLEIPDAVLEQYAR